MTACQICEGPLDPPFPVREMMYGTGESFPYAECGRCGCVQLLAVPGDLAAYYPADYCSYRPPFRPASSFGRVVRWFVEGRDAATLGRAGGMWRLLARLYPPGHPVLPPWAAGLAELRTAGRVLDVGCGSGDLLLHLARRGYHSLVGLDPYLPEGIDTGQAVRLVRQPIEQYQDDPFDVIMLHHVLEHLPDQRAALNGVRRLLAADGLCLVRVPVASGRPRQVYQTDWVEFDAPRHLIVHTRESMSRLASDCGLRVERIWDDSDEMGYRVSELYRRNLSLFDPATRRARPPEEHFTPAELREFEAQAQRDNAAGVGGRTAFVLRHEGALNHSVGVGAAATAVGASA